MTEREVKSGDFQIDGRRFVVYGLARSGIAAARLLLSRGGSVTAMDDASILPDDRSEDIEACVSSGMKLILAPNDEIKSNAIADSDVCVLSPGIPLAGLVNDSASENLTEVVGEFELGCRLCPCRIVSISGSNGKTTTACLIYEFFLGAGFTAHLVGNVGSASSMEDASGYFIGDRKVLFTDGIGVPFCERIDAVNAGDVVVAEVSSYQLETVSKFHPDVAVLMNIVEDHLARHGDMETYISMKGRMFSNQDHSDSAVLNAVDGNVLSAIDGSGGAPSRLKFSLGDETSDAFLMDETVWLRVDNGVVPIIKKEEFHPPGDHNIENLMASALAASALGVQAETITNVARKFHGVEHRIEWVGEFSGVNVYNDSKGTNPDSTIKALVSFDQPVTLIIGGYEKGSDFSQLYSYMKDRVNHVLITGATSGRINKELKAFGFESKIIAPDLRDAIEWVKGNSSDVEVLLFSPASASFDRYSSYEERGREFKRLAKEILNPVSGEGN